MTSCSGGIWPLSNSTCFLSRAGVPGNRREAPVMRDWKLARAWLQRELARSG